jgi:type III pantothenate kinase
MLLAIDVGNSRISLGVGDAAGWRARWALETDARRTVDEYGLLLHQLFALDGLDPAQVTGAVMTSVVPAMSTLMVALCREHFGRKPLVVEPGVHTGMEVRYDPPAALGGDRLAGAVAARWQSGAPVVVVDFGTATTFNVVDRAGRFIGGAIAPGVRLAVEALAEAGARLRHVPLDSGSDLPLVGRNTEQSMRAGVLLGYAELVGGLLERIDSELAVPGLPAPSVLATGGLAPLMVPLVPGLATIAPDLKLDGLRLIHGLNQ